MSTSSEEEFAWRYSHSSSCKYGGATTFVEYASSVQQLCKEFWPKSYEEVRIEHIHGGGFNRITGLSISSSLDTLQTHPSAFSDITTICSGEPSSETHTQAQQNHYILRVPWFISDFSVRAIINLSLLQSRTTIPVPHVIAFDLTDDNRSEALTLSRLAFLVNLLSTFMMT